MTSSQPPRLFPHINTVFVIVIITTLILNLFTVPLAATLISSSSPHGGNTRSLRSLSMTTSSLSDRATSLSGQTKTYSRKSRTSRPNNNCPLPPQNSLLVITLDGNLSLIDSFTGETVWVIDTGSPVITTQQSYPAGHPDINTKKHDHGRTPRNGKDEESGMGNDDLNGNGSLSQTHSSLSSSSLSQESLSSSFSSLSQASFASNPTSPLSFYSKSIQPPSRSTPLAFNPSLQSSLQGVMVGLDGKVYLNEAVLMGQDHVSSKQSNSQDAQNKGKKNQSWKYHRQKQQKQSWKHHHHHHPNSTALFPHGNDTRWHCCILPSGAITRW